MGEHADIEGAIEIEKNGTLPSVLALSANPSALSQVNRVVQLRQLEAAHARSCRREALQKAQIARLTKRMRGMVSPAQYVAVVEELEAMRRAHYGVADARGLVDRKVEV
jgi:hypothetical protein